MSTRSSTESYPAFAHIGLRENPGKNLNQVTCPDRESNPGHLVSAPYALTVTPQLDKRILAVVCNGTKAASTQFNIPITYACNLGRILKESSLKGRGGPIAWPPRSPDLNPLDFYLWGHLKSLVYSSPVPDLESLRNRIVACSEDIRNIPGVWDRVRRSMRHRCEPTARRDRSGGPTIVTIKASLMRKLGQEIMSFAIRLPNLDTVRETTLKYTNMPEEDARKILVITLRDRKTNETLQRLTNTTDAAERATATKWTWGTWRDYIRQDGPMQSRCGTPTSEREDREDHCSDGLTCLPKRRGNNGRGHKKLSFVERTRDGHYKYIT
ncbi:hypothetical protein ANN_09325 [Periplaneta americana]|uniref:Uncharacterized protein n=1 Tax=Periplaneta americana TaxID=6978 RepID=A0ABQ8TMH9_PERAM|nr:hypothetical protein ANN_09325 [Periplaneta americana]